MALCGVATNSEAQLRDVVVLQPALSDVKIGLARARGSKAIEKIFKCNLA